MEELEIRLAECIEKVLLYTKEGCPFCIKAADLLENLGVKPIIEVIDDNTKIETRDALSKISKGDVRLPR